MRKPPPKIKRYQLALLFSVVIFCIITITMLFIFLVILLLQHFGIADADPGQVRLLPFALASVVIGTALALFTSHIPLAPFRETIAAVDRLAEGDFGARIHLKGPDEIQKLNASFNHMAEELGSIEMLRSDFVNNFSHEFKTPIVSIRGFAKMLKYEDITEEEREEYLDIIISESERLAQLAANVLDLSKVENQTIITDKAHYNGSEQIRRIIALLESKWTEKNVEICFDTGEIDFWGNRELLNQVWTNLIDNAIKFSSPYTAIHIGIKQDAHLTLVTVCNQGTPLSEETRAHMYDKFYQGDTSHATQGNGIGLSLAKRIIELHEGTISVKSKDKKTCFLVELPGE